MKKKTKKFLPILSILMISYVLVGPSQLNNLVEDDIFDEIIEEKELNKNDIEKFDRTINTPKSSEEGQVEWWNTDFAYRMQINITNPGSDNFIDNFAYISFNYSELVSNGKLNESLKDVRIVENDVIREYYIHMDYPETDLAQIWFKTNCSPSTTDYDTFMYYGNNSIDYESSKLLDYHPMGVMWQTLDSIYTDPDTGQEYVNDSSGPNNGLIEGAPVLQPNGKIGGCLELGGNSNPGSVLLGNPTELQITGDQTLSMWIKPVSLYGRQNPYAKAYGGEGTITLETSGSCNYYWGTGGGNTSPYQGVTSGSALGIPGTWVHIALVRDLVAGTVTWYKDGVLNRQVTAAYGSAAVSSLNAYIGRGYVNRFWGSIDDFHVFDEALSINEVRRIMNFNYTLETALANEVEQGAQVSIITRDVDGKAIPNAKVSLYNSSGLAFTEFSNEIGIAAFETIPYDYYNVTVNYTLSYTGQEATIFEGNATDGLVQFSGLYEERTFYCDIWTLDFKIEDFDEEILDLGYIEVYTDGSKTTQLANLTIESGTGTQIFRWLNVSSYYYEVYYLNHDYSQSSTLIDSNTINRVSLDQSDIYFLNQTSIGSFYSTYTFYASGSSNGNLGTTKLINASINIDAISDTMDKVDIFYINNLEQNIKIDEASFEYSSSTQDDLIEFVISDEFEAYGLVIDIYGDNSTQNDGIVEINVTQSTSPLVTADMSKIILRIMDDNAVNPVSGVIVHVYDGVVDPGNEIVNLTTDENGYAYGSQNSVEFWYLRSTYNFTLEFFDAEKTFNVNYTNPGQWNGTNLDEYNYTVNQQSNIILALIIDLSLYQTKLESLFYTNELTWGEMMSFSVNFTYKVEGSDFEPLTNPDSISCLISADFDLEVDMIHTGGGIFNVSLNSNVFSAGTGQSVLTATIQGSKEGYTDPTALLMTIILNPIIMDTNLHDYSSKDVIDNLTVSQYYNEEVNFTISYFNEGAPLSRATGANLNYYWDYGSEDNIHEDPINPGYYTFTIDTADAPNIGKYGIYITISLENHSVENFVAFIQINSRPTLINSTIDDSTNELLRISASLNESDSYLFNFTYIEALGANDIINDSNIFDYTFDDTIRGTSGSGFLDLLPNNQYQLDFNTSTRDVGDYIILVTIGKSNYEHRQVLIFLTINKRIIDLSWTGDIENAQISVFKGNVWNVSVDLKDTSRNFVDLSGASVSIDFSPISYILPLIDQGNGIYTALVDWDDVKTFFETPDTYPAVLTITKDTFATLVKDMSFIIKNREFKRVYSGDLSAGEGVVISHVSGDTFVFAVNLLDNLTSNIIPNAVVTLTFGDDLGFIALLDEDGDGVYYGNKTFTSDEINAFFSDQSLQASLSIEIENYSPYQVYFTLKITMQEIFDGVPLFYLLLGIGGIISIIGTAGIYRAVQYSNIPDFVKKIRKLKKAISGNKEISDIKITKSREEEIIERFSSYWKLIDLDLEQIFLGNIEQNKKSPVGPGDIKSGGNY